jgi:alkanesulfonate monooxygenase SsuD/methylene tetrahydromethanopterin reductase-like flavin-dependent oxidoreductase (luciferase family)
VLRHNYVYCYLSYFGYQRALDVVRGFWNAAEERGIDDNPHRLGFLQLVCVSETDRQAEIDYEEHVKYFYQKMLRIYPPFAEAPGYRSMTSMKKSSRVQAGKESARVAQEMKWQDFVDKGHIIAGSPATVREQLTEAIKLLRVGHLMVLLHIGSMPDEIARKNTELFAKEVLPAVKGLWDEYDDPWWPQAVGRQSVAPVGG